ncbi:MAG: hypothetical protein ACREBS_00400 [Nitrososphaerales archaeon]
MKPISSTVHLRRAALLAVLAVFAFSAVLTVPAYAVSVTPTQDIPTPSPVNFQTSYAFNPFFSTTPTWSALNSTQSSSVAWEAVIWNYLSYNVTTDGAGAVIRFASTQTLTDEGITIVLYKNFTDSSTSGNCVSGTDSSGNPTGTCEGSLDVDYTDPTSQATIKIGSGDWITGSPIMVMMDTDGTLTVSNQTSVLVSAFLGTAMTVSNIGVSGNVLSPSGKNYNTAAGYLSIELGGAASQIVATQGINLMVTLVIAIVPLIVIIAVVKMLGKMFDGFGKFAH